MEHNFQINLHGIIKLLSEHLYSGPDVYIRELLQNAVDAIHARRLQHPHADFVARIDVSIIDEGAKPMLVFEDNGVGLSETDVHAFLSVIGQSSKTDELSGKRQDYIGQFGIGLLSCFMVSDQIQVISKSAKSDQAVQWRGFPNGKYTIEPYHEPVTTGTKVVLLCKTGMEEFFSLDFLTATARKYGGMLPVPIYLGTTENKNPVNNEIPPWRNDSAKNDLKEAYLEFGRQQLNEQIMDVVVLESAAGGIRGAAYILPYAYKHTAKTTHRVYLKNMLLTDTAEDLLPEWAFFVKCIINAEQLRPTASRESFYEDAAMAQARTDMGECIQAYLTHLAKNNPRRLQEILRVHNLAIKALALEDDDFFKLIIDYIPLETSMGRVTLTEYKKHNKTIRYVPGLDQYRQVAQVAFAHTMWLINGGYVYDSELLQKHADLLPDIPVEEVDVTALSHEFNDLSLTERKTAAHFLAACDQALEDYQCSASIKKFMPSEIPALYVIDDNGNFVRSVEQSKMVSDSLWGSVLENLSTQTDGYAELCFNFDNPLVKKLLHLQNSALLRNCIKMLYVQALLLGHHPLSANEMMILNSGLLDLIDVSLQSQQQIDPWQTIDPKSLN